MDADEQVKKLNGLIEAALNGDFSVEVDQSDFEGEFSRLYENICALVASQQKFIAETQVAASQIYSVSEDMSLTLEEHEKLASDLQENAQIINNLNDRNCNDTTGAIEAIKNMLENNEGIIGCLNQAGRSNHEANEAIGKGVGQVYDTIGLINSIGEEMDRTVQYFERFSESTKKISQILKTVRDISRETEILSINASIESKRAGVEGRGFDVIAGSIRELSEKSRSGVMEIDKVIDEVNAGIGNLKDSIHTSYDNVTQSVENSRIIKSSLERIKTTYLDVSTNIEKISQASAAQDKLASDVSGRISAVEKNSEQASHGFKSVYSSISNQKNGVENLNSLGRSLLEAAKSLTGATKSIRSGIPGEDEVQAAAQKAFAMLERAGDGDRLTGLDPGVHKKVLDGLLKSGMFDIIWTNDAKGRFVYCNPPSPIANVRMRQWFKESMNGRKSISDVYFSVATKKPCITVSVPVREESGKIIGVMGADLHLREG